MPGVWAAEKSGAVETAQLSKNFCDAMAGAVDASTGDAYVLYEDCTDDGVLRRLVKVTTAGKETGVYLSGATDFEGLFTPGAGTKCAALADAGRLLLLGEAKAVIVEVASGKTSAIEGTWRLCASDGSRIYLADASGSVKVASVGLGDPSFPGSLSPVHSFSGKPAAIDGNGGFAMRPRDSGSVLGCLAASAGRLLACQGHGLSAVDLESGEVTELLADKQSADGLAYPCALHLGPSGRMYAQCKDGIRCLAPGGKAKLLLKAEDMCCKEDEGSPEPYPKDFIGADSKHVYFVVERNFMQGQALRRFPHGEKTPRRSGGAKTGGATKTSAAKDEAPPKEDGALSELLPEGFKLMAQAEDDAWYAAEVRSVSESKRRKAKPVRVRYCGYAEKYDEWLGLDRLRSKRIKHLQQGKAKPSKDVSELSSLAPGTKLQAMSSHDGKWYSASVVQVSTAKKWAASPVKVDFIGHGDDLDEWVGSDQLRSKALHGRKR